MLTSLLSVLSFENLLVLYLFFFFFSSRRRHTRYWRDWSSDVCSSDLRTRPDRDPHVGLREGRRIVDSVAHHRHLLALPLQLLHDVGLLRRQHFGQDLVDPDLVRHRLRGPFRVPR